MGKYHRSLVDCSKIKPFLEELVQRCGSPDAAAEYIGIGTTSVYRIRNEEHCTMQKRTAQLILASLEHKRNEDAVTERNRRNRLALGLNTQDRIEDKLERLAGY